MLYNNYLRDKFQNAIKIKKAEGNPCIIEKSKGKDLKDYKIYGNSYQATRSGKNLLDMNKLINERQESSLSSGAKYYAMQLKPNTSYTLSTNCYTDTLASFFINLPELASTTVNNGVYAEATYRTVTTDDTGILWIWTRIIDDGIAILDTTDFDNGTYWVQLEEGTMPTTYEQYGTSPSPDYPSEVQSVGELVTDETDINYGKYKIPVTARSKNLLDVKSAYLRHSDTKTEQTDTGFISYRGYTPANVYDITSVLKPNTTYYVYRDLLKYDSDGNEYIMKGNGNSVVGQIKIVFDDGSYYYQYSFGGYVYYVDSSGKGSVFSKTEICSFVTPSSFSKVTINTYLSPGNSSEIQDYDASKTYYVEWKNVYLGTEPYTDYEPYHEPITTNIYLDEPLRKVGDYADYIDFKNGMVVRNVLESMFTIGYRGVYKKLTNVVRLSYATQGFLPATKRDYAMLSVLLPYKSRAWDDNSENIFHHNYLTTNYYYSLSWNRLGLTYDGTNAYRIDDETQIALTDNEICTIAHNYLLSLPEEDRMLYMILNTPTQTPISLPILPTFKGITTVYEVGTAIQPSNMEIKYVK